MGNAKFLHNDELQELIKETGGAPRLVQEYIDIISTKYSWATVMTFVTQGVIIFETQASYNGWLICQG